MGGALQLLGVNFGEHLLPPSKDNEKGYWEHPGIIALHEELLHSLGSRWDDDKPLPSDWIKQAITRNVRSRLIGILKRDFAKSSLVGIKDPRSEDCENHIGGSLIEPGQSTKEST